MTMAACRLTASNQMEERSRITSSINTHREHQQHLQLFESRHQLLNLTQSSDRRLHDQIHHPTDGWFRRPLRSRYPCMEVLVFFLSQRLGRQIRQEVEFPSCRPTWNIFPDSMPPHCPGQTPWSQTNRCR